jgi:hypothetical protein
VWELLPFPDETDLETYNRNDLKGVCFLVLGFLIIRVFGNDKFRERRAHQSTAELRGSVERGGQR